MFQVCVVTTYLRLPKRTRLQLRKPKETHDYQWRFFHCLQPMGQTASSLQMIGINGFGKTRTTGVMTPSDPMNAYCYPPLFLAAKLLTTMSMNPTYLRHYSTTFRKPQRKVECVHYFIGDKLDLGEGVNDTKNTVESVTCMNDTG